MESISFFADEQDAKVLIDRLNAHSEIAFIVPDGPTDRQAAYSAWLREVRGSSEALLDGELSDGDDPEIGQPVEISPRPPRRWQAVPAVESARDGLYTLWHVFGVPLSMYGEDGREQVIADPWAGWMELRPGADPRTPSFGARHPAEIRLELMTRQRPYSAEEKASLPMLVPYWCGTEEILVLSEIRSSNKSYEMGPRSTRVWWDDLYWWFRRSAAQVGEFYQGETECGCCIRLGEYSFWALPSALEKLKRGMAYDARGHDLEEAIQEAAAPQSAPDERPTRRRDYKKR